MRILLIHQYFLEKNQGGGSRFNEMSRIWASQGHTISVISGMVHYTTGKKDPKYRGAFFATEQYDKGITVHRCHVSESYNSSFLGRLWAYFSFVLSSVTCGIFNTREQYDVIIVTSPPLFVAITGIVLSKIKRIPFVFEVRDLWPESAIDTGVLTNSLLIKLSYWLEKQAYKSASLINVVTPAFRKALIEKKGIVPEKIIMIPNAADFSIADRIALNFDRDAFRKENGLENRFVITYVGAHGVANHLKQLIDIAELLKQTNVLFLSIGDGMQRNQLIDEAKLRNIDNVKFIGPVSKEEVFKYILASDCGTSVLKKCDTFKTIYSNKTFDYMSCRKPILLAIDGVSRELVETAQCGIYVEPENPEAFKEGVLAYLNDPERVKRDGENGYTYAKKHFNRETLATQYAEHLMKVR